MDDLRQALRDAAERHILEQEHLVLNFLQTFETHRPPTPTRCPPAPTITLPETNGDGGKPGDVGLSSMVATPNSHPPAPGRRLSFPRPVLRCAGLDDEFIREQVYVDSKPSFSWSALSCAGPDDEISREFSYVDSISEQIAGAPEHIYKLCFSRLNAMISWWVSLKEPVRRGPVAALVASRFFHALCVGVIALNGVFVVYATDHHVWHATQGLQPSETSFMTWAEISFTGFYCMELALKLCVHRLYYFCSDSWRWNLLDLNLVLFSIVDLIMTLTVMANRQESHASMTYMRAVRVFKVSRVLRMFRAVHFFTDLRLMIDCVMGSFIALFWCLVLIAFVLYMFALLFVQAVPVTLADVGEDALLLGQFFGSVQTAMVSLFQVTTGGRDWADLYELIEHMGPSYAALFIFYICFFVIAIWNIVTSAFIEKTLKLAQPDVDTLIMNKRRHNITYAKEIAALVTAKCKDKHTTISEEDFKTLSNDPQFREYLSVRDIDIKDVKVFFRMLSSVKGCDGVDLSTFVGGCLRMQGLATSIDLHTLSFETKLMLDRQRERNQQSWMVCMEKLDMIETLLRGHGEL